MQYAIASDASIKRASYRIKYLISTTLSDFKDLVTIFDFGNLRTIYDFSNSIIISDISNNICLQEQ